MITYILILINIISYLLVPNYLYQILSLNLFIYTNEFYWQLLTSMFLHGSIEHLIFNMIVLFQFGKILENFIGKFKFIFLYLSGGVFANILSVFYIYFFNNNANILGASGAICALMGAYAFYDKNSLKGLIIALILISFIPMFMGLNIAWYAHFFGFAYGYIFAKILK